MSLRAQATLVGDDPSELERHFGHEAEGAAARRLRELEPVRLERCERFGGKALGAELCLDGLNEVIAKRTEIRNVDSDPEYRQQGARVGEQKTLLPFDQTRFRHQSSFVGGSSLSVTDRPPSRSSIFFVQRTTARRTDQPAPTCSRCGAVFMDQSAEEVTALNAHRQRRGRNGRQANRRRESDRVVGPMLVVMRHIDAKDALEMAATDDQEAVEAVFARRVRTHRSA